MMGHLDWGGTCLSRYGHSSAFPSKTDQIMAKYRPIAPKPTLVTPKPFDSNSHSHSNSNSALDSRPRFTTRSESGRFSRTRRKASDSTISPSPRTRKRRRGPSNLSDLASEKSQSVVTAAGNSPVADRRKMMYPFGGSFSVHKVSVEKESGFMEKAATAASIERNVLDKKSDAFGGLSIKEVINSVGEMGVQNPAKCLSVQRMQDTQCGCGSVKYWGFPIVSDVQQQLQEKNGQNLVTLPLLSETPSWKDSGLSCPASNSTSPQVNKANASTNKEGFQLRLFGRNISNKEVVSCPNGSHESPKPATIVPIFDISFLERKYAGFLDPLVLLLDGGRHDVLWFNPAYKTMLKAADTSESLAIIPTPLGCFIFKSVSDGMVSKAILWRFIKNFTNPETVRGSDHGIPDNRDHDLMPDSFSTTEHRHHRNMQRPSNDVVSWTSPAGKSLNSLNKGVIMPQPVRPVGSSVSIEYIKDDNMHISPLSKTMDEIEEHIETEAYPALISDSKNRVKWTNSAYKNMVGQPECSWLESTVCCCNNKGHSNSCSSARNRINGEVELKYERPLPATAFSCFARIQWTNKGEKSSIRTHCDVVKIVTSIPLSYVYAWKFHIAAPFGHICKSLGPLK